MYTLVLNIILNLSSLQQGQETEKCTLYRLFQTRGSLYTFSPSHSYPSILLLLCF